MAAASSGFPHFDLLPLRSRRRDRFRPAASRRQCVALPGGDRLPRLDLRRVLGGRLCGRLLGRRRLRGGVRFLLGRPIPTIFLLFQQGLDPTFSATLSPPHSANGSILDPVTAVVIGLPTLGSIPKLAPQAFCPIVQSTADKLFGRGFDFLLQTFLNCAFFLDFLDVLSPPGTRNRAASAALFHQIYAT